MGHVTTDRLTQAWKDLNKAEYYIEEESRLVLEFLNSSVEEATKTAEETETLDTLNQNRFFEMKETLGRHKERARHEENYPDTDDCNELEQIVSRLRTALKSIKPQVERKVKQWVLNADDDIYTDETAEDRFPTANFDPLKH